MTIYDLANRNHRFNLRHIIFMLEPEIEARLSMPRLMVNEDYSGNGMD